jgi:VanZ family protein
MAAVDRGNSRTGLLLWAGAILAVIVGSLSPGDSALIHVVDRLTSNISDKVVHFSAYVILASLPVLSVRSRGRAFGWAASMALLGLVLEIGQAWVPGRTPDVADEIANVLGVAVGILLALPVRRRLRLQ